MKNAILVGILVMIWWSNGVSADGIPFDGDRVKDRTTSLLQLTKSQQEALDSTDNWKISLTQEQQALLEHEAGFAPEQLVVYPLHVAKDTCTCEVLNMGIRFVHDVIEIPHYLLGVDLDDRHRTKEDRLHGRTRSSPNTFAVLRPTPVSTASAECRTFLRDMSVCGMLFMLAVGIICKERLPKLSRKGKRRNQKG